MNCAKVYVNYVKMCVNCVIAFKDVSTVLKCM